MDFQVESLAPCRKRITITIPPGRVKEEFDTQYDEINDSVALPGFRKGRAPRKLLEKRFGTHLGREVKEKLIESALKRLVEDEKVEPLRPPEIDLEELEVDPEAALELTFELVTKPEFETPDFQGLEVKVPAVEITDEEITEAIDRLRQSEASLETVEDATVQKEDVLVVDWKALDGDSVEAHDENGYYLAGRGVLAGFVAEGLDEALEGKSPGATIDLEVRAAADDPREELRDRELTLEVVLKDIKRYVLPEIDEEFLKSHDFDDEEEMRDEVRKQMRRGALRARDREAEEKLIGQLVEGIEMSLPEDFVESELEVWARRKRMSLEMEEVAKEEIDKTIAAERDEAKTAVERDLRRFFLLDRIAEAEDVKVTEPDLLQTIQTMARAYGRSEEEIISSYKDADRRAELMNQIRQRKTAEIIRRAATIVEEAPADDSPPQDEA